MDIKKETLKEKLISVDLSSLYRLPNRLIPEEKVELKMVEYYKYYQTETDSIYRLFTKYLLKKLYRDNVDRNPSEIYKFYKSSVYNNVLIDYNNRIDLLVTRVCSSFLNIEFYKIEEQTEDKFIVQFKVTTLT